MKERPEQRAAGWIYYYYDRRIKDYQNYANKINFLKAIENLIMSLLVLNLKNDHRSKHGLLNTRPYMSHLRAQN